MAKREQATHDRRWRELVEELSGGYSESGIACEVSRVLGEVWRVAGRLVRSDADMERLCAAAPAIILSLPSESEVTPLGHELTYDLDALRAQAHAAETLGAALA